VFLRADIMPPLVLLSISWFIANVGSESATPSRPNIVMMLVDDIGMNEFGFTANTGPSVCSNTQTPNIDALALSEGLVISNSYSFKVCSPTRSSLMTGRYPSTLGLSNFVFSPNFPAALTRQVSTISDEFKANGYSTHFIGKWHLGFMSWEYTPMYRGFDSFNGFYGGYSYYFEHTMLAPCTSTLSAQCDSYYDMRSDDEPNWGPIETQAYGTILERDQTLDLLDDLESSDSPFFLFLSWQAAHIPLEAPDEYLDRYGDETEYKRRVTQAQISVLDDCVQDVVDSLKAKGIWDNTLLVFSSDNGPAYGYSDSFPLRGYKNSSFEGGVRVPAFVSGGYLAEERRGQKLDSVLMHVADWYPTLLSAAGLEVGYHLSTKLYQSEAEDVRFVGNGVGVVPLDGLDLWGSIQFDEVDPLSSSESREMLIDLNNVGQCDASSCGAIRSGKWKYLRGGNMGVEDETEDLNNALAANGTAQWNNEYTQCTESPLGCGQLPSDINSFKCYGSETGCLFNLEEDACEFYDVGDEYPEIRDQLMERLDYYASTSPGPVILKSNQFNESVYAPKDGQFWGPFIDYERAHFEEKLMEQYRLFYPEENWENENDLESEDNAFGFDQEEEIGKISKSEVEVGLKYKGRAMSITLSTLVVVVFFVFILRNDIAYPELLPQDGKLFIYASP